jgi:mRNA-degrading endonuclease RelE of RelBE toxin-antitoxin system
LKAIEFDRGLLKQLRALPKARRRDIGELIAAVQETFGHPHQHGGIGMRKLPRGHYEARLGLGQRLLFENRTDALYFKLLGSHDEVNRFLKGLR